MRLRSVLTAALLALAACSSDSVTGLDQTIYNATYSGPATFWMSSPLANTVPPPSGETMSMTLSQLGRDFTGSFTVTDSTGNPVYSGSVAGRTTSSGGDFTFVIPGACPGTMYGSFTSTDAALTGSASGRDCSAPSLGTGLHITFTNLARR
jgi:hypothetical protein